MCTKKGAIISKPGERLGYQKRISPGFRIVKKKYHDEKESTKQYKNKIIWKIQR